MVSVGIIWSAEGWPTFNVYCEFASLLGSLALCGKLPCDNHAAQVEVKAALKYEGEKKTLYGGRGKALPSSLWDLYHALFGEVLGSTPWLFFFFQLGPRVVPSLADDADNRVTNKIGKGYCACFQCETTKEGTGNRARGPQLLFFFFSESKLKQDRSQLQGRKSQAEIGYAKFAKFASFFFP